MKAGQWKLPKLKYKEGEKSRVRGRAEHECPRTLGQMELHKEEERGNKAEELFEGIMAENLPKIMKIQPEIQDA